MALEKIKTLTKREPFKILFSILPYSNRGKGFRLWLTFSFHTIYTLSCLCITTTALLAR